jgi:hypothetical protein
MREDRRTGLLGRRCVDPIITIARFCRSRLLPSIEQSPLIRRELLGRKSRRPPLSHMIFENGSQLYVRAGRVKAVEFSGEN